MDGWKETSEIKDGFHYLPTTPEELEPVGVALPIQGELREGQVGHSRGEGG